ncbi:unnamed protein product [Rotaria socialis]|uniref:F-box domain-containing protein n=1 Tax=Rotaria socialis TaxID=392032 RepID=A0A817SJJ5_9BILA|nr:unnamed protein product [Rotaria socialis]CAF3334103.1 unnamed protein product [Rotaria socialis]CAF3357172.1 unnamed protein product [Rotaria socialis]CAF3698769.1 unnamed protein product [Rotaria socialis]CAF4131178.1 unnamed protein product [Rotaria socialis]
MYLCRLDVLPVELLHTIFAYLSAHEIFYAFHNLSDYVDAVLLNYDRYLVNFGSVLKSQFDVTCCYIRPDRVISLTLLDDDETPGQSEVFFSRFNIEQFTYLRSFDMSFMNDNTCKQLSNLDQLKYLSSLEMPRMFQPHCTDFDSAIRNLLPQLNRLAVYNTAHLIDQPLPRLRHLNLKFCHYWQLSKLLSQMPNLYSFDVILSVDLRTNWSYDVPLLPHLRRFVLSTNSEQVTMIQIEQLLSKMPNLTHFELDTQGNMDLIDGQQWELLISHLVVFNFRIHLCSLFNVPKNTILESFRSLFWLEHKQWFVAYDDPNIFTVPRFASSIVTHPYVNWPPLCTSFDFNFHQYIRCIRLSSLDSVPHSFINVTSLVFDTEGITTDIGLFAFLDLLEQMPCVRSLSFRNLPVLTSVPNNVVLKNIRNVHVQNAYTTAESRLQLDINRLCMIFPQIERLNMELTSSQDFVLLIDQLKYLSIVKVEFCHSSPIDTDSYLTRDWLTKNSRRLKTNNNFMYKCIHNKIHLWINNDKTEFQTSDQWTVFPVSLWKWAMSWFDDRRI